MWPFKDKNKMKRGPTGKAKPLVDIPDILPQNGKIYIAVPMSDLTWSIGAWESDRSKYRILKGGFTSEADVKEAEKVLKGKIRYF